GQPLALLDGEVDVGERVRLHLVGKKYFFDGVHLQQRSVLHFYRSLTRSFLSQALMSERTTASPSRRPARTSMVDTELLPSFTFARTASSLPGSSLNSSTVESGCAPAGRPT